MKKLILAGAGHAHLDTIMNLDSLAAAICHVTVVSDGYDHYYSGMGPGLLSGLYSPSETRFHVRRMVEARGGEFINARVARIEANNRRIALSNNRLLDYDLLSCNLGSEIIPMVGQAENIIPVKPIENLYAAGREIERRGKKERLRVVVIGGGAAGIEIAGNLSRLSRQALHPLDITLVSKDQILFRHPAKMRRLALMSFAQRGIRVREQEQVKQITGREVVFHSGKQLPFDFTFNAAGIRPSPVFRDSGLKLGSDGGLMVNEYLQSEDEPAIFGGGDCVNFAPRHLDRVGVYAVRQGPILYKNITAALRGGAMQPFRPQARYLSILNLGNDRGILAWRSCVAQGRLAFLLKNYIDKKFMKRFQVSGETGETG